MSAEEFLEGAMALPAAARFRLGIRLLESLEVVPDPAEAAEVEPSVEPPK